MGFYPQPNTWQCGPFALKHALAILGRFVDEKDLSKAAKATRGGTDERMLSRAAKHFDSKLLEIRKLKDDKSKTILLVEHKMDVVRELADRVIVFHNGSLVADGEPAEVIASPIVQEAYLGIAAK